MLRRLWKGRSDASEDASATHDDDDPASTTPVTLVCSPGCGGGGGWGCGADWDAQMPADGGALSTPPHGGGGDDTFDAFIRAGDVGAGGGGGSGFSPVAPPGHRASPLHVALMRQRCPHAAGRRGRPPRGSSSGSTCCWGLAVG